MELFASVLHLDRKDCRVLKIQDAYSIHRVVYSLFEDVRQQEEKKASIPSGIQWVDKGGDVYQRKILILSDRQPKSSVNGENGEVTTKTLSERFLSYPRYRFEVIVNPTIRESASRKLRPIREREAIADWFIDRANTQWGFQVSRAHLQVGSIQVLRFEAKHPVTLQQVKVTGYLHVSNQATFIKSFSHGIGRGRSFGCGLLQIVPITEFP